MKKIYLFIISAVLALLVVPSVTAQSKYVTFLFTFDGGGAQATGCIALTGAAIQVPFSLGPEENLIPGPNILALSVTVTGAASGNGTFGLEDFGAFYWESNGGLLDFNQEMVGQPTDTDPWGTQTEGAGGDFNLFGATSTAPFGQWYFELWADGGQNSPMILSSMKAGESEACRVQSVPIPTLTAWSKFAMFLLFAGLAAFVFRRRVVLANS